MALAAGIQWDVRATGADSNGGGFKAGASGTDFSQQDAAQFALTGLTSAGAGNTILSASAAASMVGNVANAISGTNITAGFYEVVSVVVGVSITFSTNNAAGSICTGVAASGVVNIGGALLTIGAALAALSAGNDVWVKGPANFSITTGLSVPAGVDSTDATNVIGYTSTHGDNPRNTNRPMIVVNNAAIIAVTLSAAHAYLGFFLLSGGVGGTKGTTGAQANSIRGVIEGCSATGFTAYGIRISADGNNTLIDCEASAMVAGATAGIATLGDTGIALWCYSHDNPCTGIVGTTASARFHGCISESNTGASSDGFNITGGLGCTALTDCLSYNNGRHGLLFGAYCINPVVRNSIFYGNAGYGIRNDSGGASQGKGATMDYNAFGNNTSGARLNVVAGTHDVTLTADPFTDAPNADFTLNAAAGGGAACRAAGYPGTLVGL